MIRPNVNLERYKYSVSNIILTYEDLNEEISINNNLIRNILISNNYENTISSAFMISMMVPKNRYEEIVTHMNTLTVTMTINKNFLGYINSTDSADKFDESSTAQDSLYATITLKALNNSNLSTSVANRLPIDAPKNVETSDTVDYSQDLLPLDLYLYDADRIGKYKINMSFIIDGGMNDCIYHMMKDRGLSNLLVDPVSENIGSTYVIPYGHLGDNIQKLNEYYGIYNYPYLFYMDPRRIYLINKGNLGRCLEKGELGTVNIYLEKLDEAGLSTQTGCYCDEENKIYILNAIEFDIVDNDSSIDYVAGGRITTVIRGTGEIKRDTIGNYNIDRSYVVNNAKQHSQLIYNIKESKRSVVLTFENVDINIFTPNKAFSIIPDDSFYSKDYNIAGSYRLISSKIILARKGENEFKSVVQIVLNKI